jgi:hypothetical protein
MNKSRRLTTALQLADDPEGGSKSNVFPKGNNHEAAIVGKKINWKPPTIVIISGFLACLEGLN